jgi:hypothetical protein
MTKVWLYLAVVVPRKKPSGREKGLIRQPRGRSTADSRLGQESLVNSSRHKRNAENANNWQRASDSFGNLIDAMEPNGTSTTPSMETIYQYDGLNSLKSAAQTVSAAKTPHGRARTVAQDPTARPDRFDRKCRQQVSL